MLILFVLKQHLMTDALN